MILSATDIALRILVWGKKKSLNYHTIMAKDLAVMQINRF